MTSRRIPSVRGLALIGAILGAVLIAAPVARAQTAVSSSTITISGNVLLNNDNISCSGSVKVTTTFVTDPVLPPSEVVFIDARSVACTGQNGTVWLNNGQANLTRPLVANDVIKTTIAIFPNTATGYLKARTALLTLNLSFNTTTGALLSASGSVSKY